MSTGRGRKGGKKQKGAQGYHHYRMDMWQGIGMGPWNLSAMYQDDRLLGQGRGISCAEQVWNNGTGAFYPRRPGRTPAASQSVPYLAPAVLSQASTLSMMPTLHYVVRFCGDIPLEPPSCPTALNPAAIVAIFAPNAEASWSSIDKPSFSATASFCVQKGLWPEHRVLIQAEPLR